MRHIFASIVMVCALSGVLCGLAACATAPTQTQAIALDAGIQAAVAFRVQHGTEDVTVWASRARVIVSIADQVRPLATADTVSVPQLAQAVNALIAQTNLKPDERAEASILVQTIARLIDANIDPANPTAVTVLAALDSVRSAAAVYLPLTG